MICVFKYVFWFKFLWLVPVHFFPSLSRSPFLSCWYPFNTAILFFHLCVALFCLTENKCCRVVLLVNQSVNHVDSPHKAWWEGMLQDYIERSSLINLVHKLVGFVFRYQKEVTLGCDWVKGSHFRMCVHSLQVAFVIPLEELLYPSTRNFIWSRLPW